VDHTDFFKWLLKLIHSWQTVFSLSHNSLLPEPHQPPTSPQSSSSKFSESWSECSGLSGLLKKKLFWLLKKSFLTVGTVEKVFFDGAVGTVAKVNLSVHTHFSELLQKRKPHGSDFFLSWHPSSHFTTNRQEKFSFLTLYTEQSQESSPKKKIPVVLKFLELSLSTIPREFEYHDSLYSNSTHDRPTLYSNQLIVIREGPDSKVHLNMSGTKWIRVSFNCIF